MFYYTERRVLVKLDPSQYGSLDNKGNRAYAFYCKRKQEYSLITVRWCLSEPILIAVSEEQYKEWSASYIVARECSVLREEPKNK